MVWTLMELVALSIVIAFVTAEAFLPIRLTAPLVFGTVVLVYAFDAGPISRLLAAPLPALLGLLSYSIYMVHPFLEYRVMKPFALAIGKVTGWQVFTDMVSPDGRTVQMFGRTAWQGDLLSVLMLALLVIASWGTFRFIEDPARKRVRTSLGLGQLSRSKSSRLPSV
jgi:peptidoglycan/LPS O-acetylase OafA/YrhL